MGHQNDFDWITWIRKIAQVHTISITSSHRETIVAVSDLNSADVDALAKETGGIFEFKKYKYQTIKFLF